MNIWIINHYAIPPSLGGLNRHYYFSKYMQAMGHSVKIFSSSQIHNSTVNMVLGKENFIEKIVDGIQYVFVRTSPYNDNGFFRVKNMLEFPLRIWDVCKHFEKPDVIYTSSPSLFAAFSALLMAKKYKLPCIVEIRDLWPESVIEYSGSSRNNPVILAMYQLEKWIYNKADKLVFTMEGGADYIRDKGWSKIIDMNKIHHINNGVDLEDFDENCKRYRINDPLLLNNEAFNVVYTGSIRPANELILILKAAKELQYNIHKNIQFIIYGSGTDVPNMAEFIKTNNLDNVFLKGKIDKKYIPFILTHSSLNILHYKIASTQKYGGSQNKLFEYFASGKPTLSDINIGYDLIKKYEAGITIASQDPSDIANAILEIAKMPEEQLGQINKNARRAAKDYDFKVLTDKVIEVLTDAVINYT